MTSGDDYSMPGSVSKCTKDGSKVSKLTLPPFGTVVVQCVGGIAPRTYYSRFVVVQREPEVQGSGNSTSNTAEFVQDLN